MDRTLFILAKFLPIYLVITEIKLTIMVADLSHNTARVAHCHYARWDVLCDNASCADDRIVTYSYAGEHYYARTEPTAVADMHRRIVLIILLPELG